MLNITALTSADKSSQVFKPKQAFNSLKKSRSWDLNVRVIKVEARLSERRSFKERSSFEQLTFQTVSTVPPPWCGAGSIPNKHSEPLSESL